MRIIRVFPCSHCKVCFARAELISAGKDKKGITIYICKPCSS